MSKVVLITGASAGIGRATADRLHAAGWTVVGASRRGTSSAGWQPLTMDVDDDEDTQRGVAAVIGEHGRLDAVVASAGWGLAGPVELTPIDEAKAQGALPAMRDQQAGRLVLVSSLGGLIALPFQAFYSASKYALEGYAEGLAYEVEPLGIHVTLVEPGNIRTDFTASRRTIGADPGGAYAEAAAKAITLMEKDEENGAPPETAAAVIERVLEARRPRRRVSVGKIGERIGIPAKRLLPHRLFEMAAGSSLGV